MLMLEREAAQSALGVGMGTPAGPDRVRYVIRRLGSNVPHLGFRTAGTLMALAAKLAIHVRPVHGAQWTTARVLTQIQLHRSSVCFHATSSFRGYVRSVRRRWSTAIRCQNRGDGVRFRVSHW